MIQHKITPELGHKIAKIVKVKDDTIIFDIQNDGCVQAEANYGLQLILHFLFAQQKFCLERSHFIEENLFYNSEIDFIHYLQNLRLGYELIISKEEYETAIQKKDNNDNADYTSRYFKTYTGAKMKEQHIWYIKEIAPFYKLFTELAEKSISNVAINKETFLMRQNYNVYAYQLQLEMDKEFRFLVQHLKKSTWEEVKCYDFKSYFY